MSQENVTKRSETAEGIGRRGLMGGAVALLAAAAGVSAAGVRSAAAAEETPSDAGAPPTESLPPRR